METLNDLHKHAVAIDTVIAEKHKALSKANANMMWAHELMSKSDGKRKEWAQQEHTKYLATWTVAKAEFDKVNAQYEGWSRFFLVLNNNGHIHRSMSCTTCFVTTEYGWLPELSGLTEAEAVEAYGEILCSVCYPTAPVAWTNGTSKASKEAKQKRAAEKAEREAKKLEKALLPDGTALRLHDERLVTLAAAKSWLTSAYEWNLDHPSYPVHEVEIVAAAVAAKTGETIEAVKQAAEKRAAKRRY